MIKFTNYILDHYILKILPTELKLKFKYNCLIVILKVLSLNYNSI